MRNKLHKRRGRPRKDRRLFLWIAGTVDYRGINDDVLTFVFRGVPVCLVRKAFQHLCGNGNGIAEGFEVRCETDIIRRNGKGYNRVAVTMQNPDYHFASLESQKILIEATFKRLNPCSFKWFTIDEFLNI